MKKSVIICAAALLAVLACNKEQQQPAAPDGALILQGTVWTETRAAIGGKTDAGWPVFWEAEDQIGLFSTDGLYANDKAVLSEADAGKADGTFTTASIKGVPQGDLYVYYPYKAGTAIGDGGTVEFEIPSVQTVTPGGTAVCKYGFAGAKAVLSGAKASFSLVHASAYIRLVLGKVEDKYASYKLESVHIAASDALAGRASLSLSGETRLVEGRNELQLRLQEAVPVDNTVLLAAALPADLSGKDVVFSFSLSDGSSSAVAEARVEGKQLKANAVNSITIPEIKLGAISGFAGGIADAENLLAFGAAMNAGEDIARWKNDKGEVTLLSDIDMTGVEWTPIDLVPVGLVIDGQGHAIKNWTSVATPLITKNQGTVRNIVLDESCKFTLAVKQFGFLVTQNHDEGVITGCVNHATAAPFKDAVTASFQFGYLCRVNYGYMADCVNTGDIIVDIPSSSANIYLGGIAAYFNVNGNIGRGGSPVAMSGCSNSGNLSVHVASCPKHLYMGGVTAGTSTTAIASSIDKGHIENCSNSGNLSYRFDAVGNGNYLNLGGVAGYVDGEVHGCSNTGSVSYETPTTGGTNITRPAVGGVAGFVRYSASSCTNAGNVSVTGMFGAASAGATGAGCNPNPSFGGVIGQIGDDSAKAYVSGELSGCHNTGGITVNSWMLNTAGTNEFVGGVCGFSTVPVSHCDNTGALDVLSRQAYCYVGGVVAKQFGDVSDCWNSGTIVYDYGLDTKDGNCSTAAYVGGVQGDAARAGCTVKNLTNRKGGDITLKRGYSTGILTYVGGVIGRCNTSQAELSGLVNEDNVMGSSSVHTETIGGIAGQSHAELIHDCTSRCIIRSMTDHENAGAGGLFGFASGPGTPVTVRDCSAYAEIEVTGSLGRAGLLAGGVGNTTQAWDNVTVDGSMTTDPAVIHTGILLGGLRGVNDAEKLLTIGGNAPVKVRATARLNGTAVTAADLIPEKLCGYFMPDGAYRNKVVFTSVILE